MATHIIHLLYMLFIPFVLGPFFSEVHVQGFIETEPTAQAKKSMKVIAQQCKMDEDTVEFLHRDSWLGSDMLRRGVAAKL